MEIINNGAIHPERVTSYLLGKKIRFTETSPNGVYRGGRRVGASSESPDTEFIGIVKFVEPGRKIRCEDVTELKNGASIPIGTREIDINSGYFRTVVVI